MKKLVYPAPAAKGLNKDWTLIIPLVCSWIDKPVSASLFEQRNFLFIALFCEIQNIIDKNKMIFYSYLKVIDCQCHKCPV